MKFKPGLIYKYGIYCLSKVPFHIDPIYPDFMCIGAPRSGTTWLYKSMKSNKNVCLPFGKEVHFFDDLHTYFKFNPNIESHWKWYYLMFYPGKGRIKGDITPAYFTLGKEKISIIKQRMPAVKLIMLIRNPIERAWSGLRRGLNVDYHMRPSDIGDEKALIDRLKSNSIVLRTNYIRAIENWEEYFDDIQYIFFEDICKDPVFTINLICMHCGIDINGMDMNVIMKKNINSAPKECIPKDVKKYLVSQYLEQIKFLENKFNKNLGSWIEF